MRDRLTSFAVIVTFTALALAGCKKEDETPPANQAMQQYPQQQYPQQQYPQQQYPQQQQPVAQQPVAQQPAAQQPAAQQPAAAAASPTPSPLATPCKTDAECIGAKCNVAAGKCQFPCGSNNDCQSGWACNLQLGQVCMPSGQVAPK
jgi:predicted small lipoprotein YifL